LVFLSDLGDKLGVETPVMDSMICFVATIMQIDFTKEEKRTFESIGL